MRFIENKSEKIVKGIFVGGILYFIGNVLIYLATLSTASTEIGHKITIGIFYLATFCKPIGILVIFKFLCDFIYKILKTLDSYNNK
ncbi:Uncharacterised protein [uncultured Clostridium sp.]|uniref:hypothetical protein n=1 Tax=uncultured Clostridium sp. TaxID=59620 RepID=UPI00082146F2|nr:hypothetical protein [uncultured Clostridium sp.]SCK04414.1 Uncharacterised protein [uncultured Clostridium sp.]